MGPIINTRNNEVSPFYHPVFEVLYFSSNGQLYNFGAFDIYKSYHIHNKWSEPINIGPLVNGSGSEFISLLMRVLKICIMHDHLLKIWINRIYILFHFLWAPDPMQLPD